MMGNASERIWATMMDPDCARSGTFVDCAEFPIKPNADAVQYMPVDLAPAPSWQPISSAPKDGTPILAAGANLGVPAKGYHQAVVEWTQDERTPEQIKAECGEDFSGWYCDDNSDDRLEFLSHWMPLPAPPEAS